MNNSKKTVTNLATMKAKIAERQAPAYFVHPEYQHENGDPVIVAAPAEMTKDLLDRDFKESTEAAFEAQGKDPETEPKPAAKPAVVVDKK